MCYYTASMATGQLKLGRTSSPKSYSRREKIKSSRTRDLKHLSGKCKLPVLKQHRRDIPFITDQAY